MHNPSLYVLVAGITEAVQGMAWVLGLAVEELYIAEFLGVKLLGRGLGVKLRWAMRWSPNRSRRTVSRHPGLLHHFTVPGIVDMHYNSFGEITQDGLEARGGMADSPCVLTMSVHG